jgi:hypothetical protein
MIGKVALNSSKLIDFNTYQNAIYYVDDVIRRIYERILRFKNHSICFFFFSDHGEDPISDAGSWNHLIVYFTWPMARIPFYVWCSETYKQNYPSRIEHLFKNKDRIFTSDLFFDLFVGMSGINSTKYNPIFDVSSPQYILNETNAVIAKKKKFTSDPEFIAEMNAKKLINYTIVAGSCDTIFMLRHARGISILNFAVDLLFVDSKFVVGLNKLDKVDLDLSEYISELPPDFQLLWLDLKFINPNNVQKASQTLEKIFSTSNMKNRVLIVVSDLDALSLFMKNGWNVSWDMSSDFLNADNENFVRLKIIKHNITAITSSVTNLNQLVSLPKHVNFYARQMDWSFSDINLTAKISQQRRVSKFLVKFVSPYRL